MNSGPSESGKKGAETEARTESGRAEVDLAKVDGKVKASSVRKVGEIAGKHPDAVLTLIRAWMNREA